MFVDCSKCRRLYRSHQEWAHHTRSDHMRRWRCKGGKSSTHGPLSFSTEADYRSHIRDAHATSINDRQIQLLVERSGRKNAVVLTSCPLCQMEDHIAATGVENHVTSHLLDLALYCLPLEHACPELDTISQDSIVNTGIYSARSTIPDTIASNRSAKSALGQQSSRSGSVRRIDVETDSGLGTMEFSDDLCVSPGDREDEWGFLLDPLGFRQVLSKTYRESGTKGHHEVHKQQLGEPRGHVYGPLLDLTSRNLQRLHHSYLGHLRMEPTESSILSARRIVRPTETHSCWFCAITKLEVCDDGEPCYACSLMSRGCVRTNLVDMIDDFVPCEYQT